MTNCMRYTNIDCIVKTKQKKLLYINLRKRTVTGMEIILIIQGKPIDSIRLLNYNSQTLICSLCAMLTMCVFLTCV